MRDDSATGDDIADGSLDGGEIKDGSLTGGDIADKSIGGAQGGPATKVPNADMLDGHGSTRYGVGLQMGTSRTCRMTVPTDLFPVGITDAVADDNSLAISPEALEIRDFTARGDGLDERRRVDADHAASAAPGTQMRPNDSGSQVCHAPSNQQCPVPGQSNWGSVHRAGGDPETRKSAYSYRAVR